MERRPAVAHNETYSKDGKQHLAGIQYESGSFTFYDLPISKVKDIIKTTDGNVIYYKYGKSAGTPKSVLHATKEVDGARTFDNESISQLNQNIKGSYTIDQKLITMFEISGKDGRLIPVIPDNGFKPSSVSPSGEFSNLQSTSSKIIFFHTQKLRN